MNDVEARKNVNPCETPAAYAGDFVASPQNFLFTRHSQMSSAPQHPRQP
jgi:hypothetical protein